MNRLLILAAAFAAATSTPALAQVSGNSGALLGPTTVPATATKPAGQAVTTAGSAVVVGSGAHAGGPAPIVAGTVPQTRGFADSVTDGTGKIGEGTKKTGAAIGRSGVTVNPAGGAKGAMSAPGSVTRQAGRLGDVVTPPH